MRVEFQFSFMLRLNWKEFVDKSLTRLITDKSDAVNEIWNLVLRYFIGEAADVKYEILK